MTALPSLHVLRAALEQALWSTAMIGAVGALSCSVTISEASLFPPRLEALPPMGEFVRSNVELTTPDGVRLRGWRVERPGSVRTVLFFYGNRSSVVDSAWSLDWLGQALQADVVAFDYRGYGFSDGTPSVDQSVLNDALKGDSTFTSLRTAPLTDVPHVTEPTLFVGGDSDVLATPKSVARLSGACAARPVQRCNVPGGHGDVGLENPAVRACVQRFLAAAGPG